MTPSLSPLRSIRTFQQPGVAFDPVEHRYTFHGERVVNVTSVMRDHKISANWDRVPGDVLAHKRDLGLAAHAAAHYYDDGDLQPDTVDPAVTPYLAGWVQFVTEMDFEPLLLETLLVHPLLKYGGTVDRFGILHRLQDPALPYRVPAVVDIKTGDPDDAGANVQTAAYEQLIRAVIPPDLGLDPDGWDEAWPRYSVQLLPSGTYKLCTYTSPRDLQRFMWARNLEASAHPSWRRS